MKTTIKMILLLTAVALLAVLSSSVVSRVRAEHVASPYSIWFLETRIPGKIPPEIAEVTLPEKLKAIQANQTMPFFEGQRANGDHVTTSEPGDGSSKQFTLKLAQQGLDITFNNKNNSMTTMGSGLPRSLSQVTEDCRQFGGLESDRNTDTLLGYRTYHILIDRPDITIQQWIAPDLGCALIKTIAVRKSDGGIVIREATKATADPPDDALFNVPADRVEMKPSAYFLSLEPPDPGHKPSDLISGYAVVDKRYAEFQAMRAGR